jgi:hypothetical protein
MSFSEYLFLLTILIKPQSGFKIAFAMLDQDGNERIDKEEFRVSQHFFRPSLKRFNRRTRQGVHSVKNGIINSEKIGVFLKNLCYDPFVAKTSSSFEQKRRI